MSFKMLAQNLTNLRQLDLSDVNMFSVELGSLRNLSSSLTFLNLGYCGLRGKFFDNIFHLSNLQKLDLSDNFDLINYFPKANGSSSIGNLRSLNYLDLSYCSFSGFILASLDNLTNITYLSLRDNHFSGEIQSSLSNLKQLTHLDLTSNNFSGFIPASLDNLTQITHLDLSYNHFFGEIPSWLSNLKQLTYLDLGFNNFRGYIPSSIVNLTQLTTLVLSSNQLVGSIPSQIIPNLITLNLYNNSLNGTIPSWVFTLTSLLNLTLSFNKLTGPILEFQYYSLEFVYLDNNELHGPLPESIFQLVNLTVLILSSNKLSGIVEMNKFSKLQNLEMLHLNYNSLSLSIDTNVNFPLPKLSYLGLASCNLSEFPNFQKTQESLRELDLSNNKIHSFTMFGKLAGGKPYSICDLHALEILNLSNNNLSGLIPECLGNFSSGLSVLDLGMNSFHGNNLGTFAKGNRVRNIDLSGNQLEGPIPRSLINCQYLEVLDLRKNKLNDTFPYWLETLPELKVLVLRSNRFHGSIRSSKEKHPFPKLQILDLANNDFCGPLPKRYFKNLKAMMNMNEDESQPKYMGNFYYQDAVMLTIKGLEVEYVKILTTLATIDLSNNSFQGEIPKTIGKLSLIRGLNVSHNNLTGHIPLVLKNLRVLESLDLSSNNLTGEIPGQLTSLTFLEILNLSQNHLVGRIPQGNQFNTFRNDSYFGNRGLCGAPLSKKCNFDEAPPPPPPMVVQEEEDLVFASGFGWKVVLMGYGCGIIVGMFVGYLMFLTGKPKWLVVIIEEKILEVVKRRNMSAHRHGRRRN